MNTQSIDISLYQKGDIALEDIYKKFKNCFMRYAGKVLSSEFYAEDVVQDVFIGLFQQTNYFVSEAAALKYIYAAIYNRCIDLVRHRQIAQRYEEIYSNEKNRVVHINGYNDLLAKEFFVIVEKRINSLPPKCKQIFIMKFQKEFSNPEISRNLGLSLRTIENQLYIELGEFFVNRRIDIYVLEYVSDRKYFFCLLSVFYFRFV